MKAFNKVLRTPSLLAAAAVVLIMATSGFAKNRDNTSSHCIPNPAVAHYADMLPQPVGGYEAIMNKIEYPSLAVNAKLEGDVLAQISVDDNGNVEDVKLLDKVGGGCDEAVVKAIKDTKFRYTSAEDSPRVKQVTVLFKFMIEN